MAQLGRTGARFGPPQDQQDQQEPAARQGPTDAPVPPVPPALQVPDEDLVGVTGARFGGHSTRRTRRSRR